MPGIDKVIYLPALIELVNKRAAELDEVSSDLKDFHNFFDSFYA